VIPARATSLGNSIKAEGVSRTIFTQLKLSEIWPIYTKKTARRIGVYNTLMRKKKHDESTGSMSMIHQRHRQDHPE